jgi:hypothetical protein
MEEQVREKIDGFTRGQGASTARVLNAERAKEENATRNSWLVWLHQSYTSSPRFKRS